MHKIVYNYCESMEEIIIECEGLARFHVEEKNEILIKNILKMCNDYGLKIKVVN